MKNELDINQAQSSTLCHAEFVNFLLADGGPDYEQDMECFHRTPYLRAKIEIRNGSSLPEGREKFPNQFVAQVAAARFFRLTEMALLRLKKMFSLEEMTVILNLNCGPVISWDPTRSVAGMLADDIGIEHPSELLTGSTMRVLLDKLASLSSLENAALIDFCETLWRSLNGEPIEDLCVKLGMHLADHE
jgi:hypothetical protein